MTYKKEYDSMLIDHMSKGLSFESFGAVVNVTVDTLDLWLVEEPSFDNAEKIGSLHRKLLWEKMGLIGAQGKATGFDRQAWEMLKPPNSPRRRKFDRNKVQGLTRDITQKVKALPRQVKET